MPERMRLETRADPLGHPAVIAWDQLQVLGEPAAGIEILKERPETVRKSAVYRIEGAGPDGSSVVAKRCCSEMARLERTLYEKILPNLPVTALRYYGFVWEPDGRFGWIFLEDAGDARYSALNEEHRRLAARWLGAMHTSAASLAGLAATACLPDGGPRRYLEHLRSARCTILKYLPNPALKPGEVRALEVILRQLDSLERRWPRLEAVCEIMPRTLVHGDFISKNVRIRNKPSGATLVPFDWEKAGWGVPAVDLAQATRPDSDFLADVDLRAYCSTVQHRWPDLNLRALRDVANCGKTFRCLAAIDWEALGLEFECVEWPVKNMRLYGAEMAHSIREARWA